MRGFQILDLANLAAPALTGRVPVSGTPTDVLLRGSTALLALSDVVTWTQAVTTAAPVASTGSQLWAIDVSAGAAPRVVARVDLAGTLQATRLVGNFLYAFSVESRFPSTPNEPMGAVAHLWSLDVSKPAAPRQLAHVAVDQAGSTFFADLGEARITLGQTLPGDAAGTRFQVYALAADGTLTPGAVFGVDRTRLTSARAMRYDPVRKVFAALLAPPERTGATLHLWSSPTPDAVTVAGKVPVLAADEVLALVRVEGARVYAHAFSPSSSHLYVVDGADPAKPIVSKPLSLPGALWDLEVRGDRALALATSADPLPRTTSLVLVDGGATDPRVLATVVVGSDPGMANSGPTFDARPAFQLFDAEGFAAVPVYRVDADDCQVASLALVDVSRQGLTARGWLPLTGVAARAVAVPGQAGQLALQSLRLLETFDLTDRAAPRRRGGLSVAGADRVLDVGFAGGKALVLVRTSSLRTELRVAATPDGVPLARLEVPVGARLHVSGSTAWLLSFDATALDAVDLTDPLHPRVRSTTDLVKPFLGAGSSLSGCGSEGVFVGQALVVHRTAGCSSAEKAQPASLRPRPGSTDPSAVPPSFLSQPTDGREVAVFDLSAPDAPRFAAKVKLPGYTGWGFVASGGFAWVTHFEYEASRPGWGRFVVDRLDVTTPAKPVVLSVNVPGVVVGTDAAGKRLYVREHVRAERGPKVWVDQTDLHALELTDRGTARLVGSASVPGASVATALAAGHVYAVTGPQEARASLWAVEAASMAAASEQPVPYPVQQLTATGGKLVLANLGLDSNLHALVYGLGHASRPAFEVGQSVPGWRGLYGIFGSVVVEGGAAYLACGPYGVRTIPLTP